MKGKKFLATIAALATVVSVCACGNSGGGTGETPQQSQATQKSEEADTAQGDDGETDGYYVSEAEGGKTTDQFSIWVGWTSECPDDTLVQKAMREELGMDYKVEFMQADDVLTTINLSLSSGAELPDVILMGNNPEAASALIGAGRVMNLNDIYNSDKVPNISGLDERIKDYIKDGNGDMWYIPGWYAQEYDDPWGGWTTDAWWVRTDLMEEAGVTEKDLETIEGMEEALRKFAGCKDENGNPVIPLSFVQSEDQERIILATFGVDTAAGVSKMPAVMKEGDDFVFIYDNPKYKEAYRWMNRMYREGLIDMEVTTQQSERYKEKVKSGQIAIAATDVWSSNIFNDGYEDDSVTYKFEPFQSPKVEGVVKGFTSYVNPNPQNMIFINSDTEHLNAVLNFLNWCNEPEPIRQQEINEGPKGVYWDYTDGEKWSFVDESYNAERNSGDQARVDACTPQLYQFAGYSNKWYPWFEQDLKVITTGQQLVQKWCVYVGDEIVNHRSINDYDQVKLDTESVLGRNLASMDAVADEYTAKMIMAASDDEFEEAYRTFLDQLEMRADWSAMKAEWEEAYSQQFGN